MPHDGQNHDINWVLPHPRDGVSEVISDESGCSKQSCGSYASCNLQKAPGCSSVAPELGMPREEFSKIAVMPFHMANEASLLCTRVIGLHSLVLGR